MTGNDPIRAKQTADRSRENRQFAGHLLKVLQPWSSAALESAVQRPPARPRNAMHVVGAWPPGALVSEGR
jgi:hypothetical protein